MNVNYICITPVSTNRAQSSCAKSDAIFTNFSSYFSVNWTQTDNSRWPQLSDCVLDNVNVTVTILRPQKSKTYPSCNFTHASFLEKWKRKLQKLSDNNVFFKSWCYDSLFFTKERKLGHSCSEETCEKEGSNINIQPTCPYILISSVLPWKRKPTLF